MIDSAFSLSFLRYFRGFTHCKLFVSFRSLDFGFKINRINPLLVISSKFPAITNVSQYAEMPMGVADYSKGQLKA